MVKYNMGDEFDKAVDRIEKPKIKFKSSLYDTLYGCIVASILSMFLIGGATCVNTYYYFKLDRKLDNYSKKVDKNIEEGKTIKNKLGEYHKGIKKYLADLDSKNADLSTDNELVKYRLNEINTRFDDISEKFDEISNEEINDEDSVFEDEETNSTENEEILDSDWQTSPPIHGRVKVR